MGRIFVLILILILIDFVPAEFHSVGPFPSDKEMFYGVNVQKIMYYTRRGTSTVAAVTIIVISRYRHGVIW